MDYSTATARMQFEPEPQSTYLTCAQYLGKHDRMYQKMTLPVAFFFMKVLAIASHG